MKFVSTRNKAPAVTFSQALGSSLAPDGGLYVPEVFPQFQVSDFTEGNDPKDIGSCLLAPFFAGNPLEKDLISLCQSTLDFPIPLRELPHATSVLELFHGPTAAFKDVGAKFLANAVEHLKPRSTHPRVVLVATSGDTGGAVASAFYKKKGFQVFILFPKGKISARQEKQLTAWGDNVRAFAVNGDFDACQKIVKEAFADTWWKDHWELLSANSINVGRLVPQQIYYAASSLQYFREKKVPPNYVIPTGNLGNAVAALWVKRSGLPIGKVVLATNANLSIAKYFQSGKWAPDPTVATLANAMDVGNPSNMERLFSLYPTYHDLVQDVSCVSVSDDQIRKTIQQGENKYGQIWCPHTATAVFAREKQQGSHWIIVATAHPSKFDSIVEPLVGHPIEIPKELAKLLQKESVFTEIAATLQALREAI